MDRLRLAYSPCPNDTFIFHALAHGLVESPFAWDITLADVEELNARAMKGDADVVKVSVGASVGFLDRYRLLRAGGALGRGCGPILVAKPGRGLEDLTHARVAIPGALTTANLLLELTGLAKGERVALRYDEVMPAVEEGRAEYGLVIHEGRFTYGERGLVKVLDLGQWWEAETGLPIPLGAIAVRRDLGEETARQVEEAIRASLRYAFANPEASREYVAENAQEMAPEVIAAHIQMFVTDFSLDVSEEGARAIGRLLEAATKVQGAALPAGIF